MTGQHSNLLSRLFSRSAILLLSIVSFLPTQAHTENSGQDSCEVIIPKEYYKTVRAKVRRVPSHFSTPSTESVIKNTGKIYTFRLAACILPEYINNSNEGFGTSYNQKSHEEITTEVIKWWSELETQLNNYFTNDVGIRFEVLRDPKLILFNYNVNGLELDRNATDNTRLLISKTIIDAALGADSTKYDLGILIGRPNNSRNGVAQLGGAAFPTLKGSAWCINNFTSLAHEIGHCFGAEHTHLKGDAINTEPGSGRSIMSYGSPRDFFSLPSIYQMRNTLANMNYYTDEARTKLVTIYAGNITVAPYAKEEDGIDPKLDRSRIKSEYTITKGSDFQFYLPTITKNDGNYYYNVNSFDISKHDMTHANHLRPSYKGTKDSVVIFRPHCINPSTITNTTNYVESYSDYSELGAYTFMAAVHDKSRYDAMPIKVNVVAGEPFQINNVKLQSNTKNDYSLGRQITIYWNPCTQIYGTDSKVRILFSDNFGKTFKYVLADNVPNNGSYTLTMPYLTVGYVSYEDWPNFSTGGGRFKLEVEGEIACCIYPRYDYSLQSGTAVGSGYSFNPNGQRALFKTTDNKTLPEPYVEVKSVNDIPQMTKTLVAYLNTNPNTSTQCTGTETKDGCLIRRSWTGNVNSINYTYTQLIKLPDTVTGQALVRSAAQQLATMAKPLHDNIGNIGYPYSWLPEAKDFLTAYEKVFSGTEINSSVTAADVDNLNEKMTILSHIGDDEVAKPEDGKYYQIRAYLSPYNRDTYYYLIDDDERQHFVSSDQFSDDMKQKARWRCYIKDGKYHFVSDKGNEIFSPVTAEGATYDYKTSEFQNFSNTGMERILKRGYTWGALTILNNQGFGCMVSTEGYYSVLRAAGTNGPMTPDQRCNCTNGLIVSTDFQFIPTDDAAYISNTDSLLIAIGNNTKSAVENTGITWYTQATNDNNGVNIVYAKGTFTPDDNGRVKLVIPSQLTVDNQKKNVVGIIAQEVNTKARYDNHYTYSLGTAMGDYDFDLVIPASVKSIGNKALANCTQLHTVDFENNSQLTTIGSEAFSGSNNMRFSKTRLETNALTYIGSKAFYGTAIRRLALTCHQSAVQSGSFTGASQLEYLDLRSANGSASVTRTQAGLPIHTLVFTTAGNTMSGNDENNVVRFSGSDGTCQNLVLYDLKKDEKGNYTLHGISIPTAEDKEGTIDGTFKAVKAIFNRTFNKGYSTLCLPYPATVPEGMQVYRFTERSGSNGDYTYTFTSANTLEANVPYLVLCSQDNIKIEEVTNVEVKAAKRYTIGDELATDVTSDIFAGTLGTLDHYDALGHDIYTLNATKQQWLRITDLNGTINSNAFVAPFRAFFTDTTIAGAKAVNFTTEDNVTNIETFATKVSTNPTAIYTIDGRKVNNTRSLAKGLYIIGGRKVIIQ